MAINFEPVVRGGNPVYSHRGGYGNTPGIARKAIQLAKELRRQITIEFIDSIVPVYPKSSFKWVERQLRRIRGVWMA